MPISSSLSQPADVADLALAAFAGLERVRRSRPRVHCLTNPVAMNLSANLLLAAGAVPSMTSDPEVQADFVRTSEALVINLGMLDPQRAAAAQAAVPLAQRMERPWLLDPVKIDRSQDRLAFARELVAARPAALRGNMAETEALAGSGEEAWRTFAREHALTLAATGPVDLITDGRRTVRIANGSPLMDRVTAMGCAASALAGAFLAVEPDPFLAVAAALLTMGIAGEIAEASAGGPGSFAPAFLDAVFTLDAASFTSRARLS